MFSTHDLLTLDATDRRTLFVGTGLLPAVVIVFLFFYFGPIRWSARQAFEEANIQYPQHQKEFFKESRKRFRLRIGVPETEGEYDTWFFDQLRAMEEARPRRQHRRNRRDTAPYLPHRASKSSMRVDPPRKPRPRTKSPRQLAGVSMERGRESRPGWVTAGEHAQYRRNRKLHSEVRSPGKSNDRMGGRVVRQGHRTHLKTQRPRDVLAVIEEEPAGDIDVSSGRARKASLGNKPPVPPKGPPSTPERHPYEGLPHEPWMDYMPTPARRRHSNALSLQQSVLPNTVVTSTFGRALQQQRELDQLEVAPLLVDIADPGHLGGDEYDPDPVKKRMLEEVERFSRAEGEDALRKRMLQEALGSGSRLNQ